jgi:hypothetical protein
MMHLILGDQRSKKTEPQFLKTILSNNLTLVNILFQIKEFENHLVFLFTPGRVCPENRTWSFAQQLGPALLSFPVSSFNQFSWKF